jgi:hypothetical protein
VSEAAPKRVDGIILSEISLEILKKLSLQSVKFINGGSVFTRLWLTIAIVMTVDLKPTFLIISTGPRITRIRVIILNFKKGPQGPFFLSYFFWVGPAHKLSSVCDNMRLDTIYRFLAASFCAMFTAQGSVKTYS